MLRTDVRPTFARRPPVWTLMVPVCAPRIWVWLAPAAALASILVPSRRQVQTDHAGGRAQLQRGHQQPGQGLFVADPEPGDGYVSGGAVAAQDAKGDVLGAAAFDLAAGADAGAVGVQQHP